MIRGGEGMGHLQPISRGQRCNCFIPDTRHGIKQTCIFQYAEIFYERFCIWEQRGKNPNWIIENWNS